MDGNIVIITAFAIHGTRFPPVPRQSLAGQVLARMTGGVSSYVSAKFHLHLYGLLSFIAKLSKMSFGNNPVMLSCR